MVAVSAGRKPVERLSCFRLVVFFLVQCGPQAGGGRSPLQGHLLPEQAGSLAHTALEIAVEVLAVLEAEPVGYLIDGLLGAGQFLFCKVDDFGLNVLLRCLSRPFFTRSPK